MGDTFLLTAGMAGAAMYFLWLGWQNKTNKDAVWARHLRRAQLRGLKAERTRLWEAQTDREGLFLLLMGLIVLIGAFRLPEMILGR